MAQSRWTANGTSDAAGNLTVTFPTIAVNAEWTGIVSIPLAPNTAELQIVVDDVAVSALGGSSSYGPIQLNSTNVLTVTGTGLDPSTQYQAVLIGNLVYGTSAPVTPVPTASAVQAALTGAIESSFPAPTLFFSTSLPNGTDSYTITPPTLARTLLLRIHTNGVGTVNGPVQVYGATSGILYYNQWPYLRQTATLPPQVSWLCVVPVAGAVDTSFVVTIPSTGGTMFVVVYSDTALYDESVFYNGPTVIKETVAAGLILNGPFRVLSLFCQGTAAAQDGGGQTIVSSSTTNPNVGLTFPGGLIIPFNSSLNQSGGGQVTLVYAYP